MTDWLAVRFKDDNVLYMCPNTNITAKIGSYIKIKWMDGYKYKAKLLKKGSKFQNYFYL